MQERIECGRDDIDAGFEKATEIILTIIEPSLIDINEEPDKKNPKGQLQELLQAIIPESPVYSVTDESGPDHHKQFNISVSWIGKHLAYGSGSNKKEAEADAARHALKAKSWE